MVGPHTDWTENISGAGWVITGGGYGRILNLVVYGDKIVAVRERGITFLHAFGTPENFKLTYYNEVLPEIYSDTAAVIGGKLYFYTVSGLYVYDGSSAKKTELPFCDVGVRRQIYFVGGKPNFGQGRIACSKRRRGNFVSG